MKKIKFILIILLIFNFHPLYAYFSESGSTQEVENLINPKILINEISFKDSANDWIELIVTNDGNNGAGVILDNFFLKDDSNFVELSSDIPIYTGNYIIITFKKTNTAFKNGNTLYMDIDKSGLTGTSEQVILLNPYAKILDAVCWQNSTPTNDETEDLNEIILNLGWSGSCLNSENIKENQSIGRNSTTDLNTINDWQIFENPTKNSENKYLNFPPIAKISNQSEETTGYAPFSINLDGSDSYDPENEEITFLWDFKNGENSSSENPPSHKYENPGTYNITLRVTDEKGQTSDDSITIIVNEEKINDDEDVNINDQNREPSGIPNKEIYYISSSEDQEVEITESPPEVQKSLSDLNFLKQNIIINEFLPNPEGSDSGNEWIELKNLSNEDLNLKGLLLDDIDGGSKPYSMENYEISANGFLVIYSSDSKININNSEENIRLLTEDLGLVEDIYFETSSENLSQARNEDNNFYETETLTPGEENIFINPKNSQSQSEITEASEKNSSHTIIANTSKEQKAAKAEKNYKNGDLSEDIVISEIFPNPKGSDNGNEWIEFYNKGTEDINLGNYTLDDGKESTKPYIFSDQITIKAKEYFILEADEAKIKISNSESTFSIYDFENNLINEAAYNKAEEDKSFSLFETIDLTNNKSLQSEYFWTSEITKGEKNPILNVFEAEIVSLTPPSGFKARYQNQELDIIYDPKNIAIKMASEMIKEGNIVKITGQIIGENKYKLNKIELISEPQIPNKEKIPVDPVSVTLGSTTALSTSFLFYSKYKSKIKEFLMKFLK